MKKHFLIALTIITFLTGCEVNDNPTITLKQKDLVGSWNVTAQKVEATGNFTTAQGTDISLVFSSYGKNFKFVYTFAENPNIVSAKGSYTSVVTSQIDTKPAITQEITVDSIDNFNTGTWLVSNNAISITDKTGTTNIGEVVEYTGNLLKIKVVGKFSGEIGNADGEMFITLEKQ